MGKKSAPKPDPNIGKAALRQGELGEEWLAFEKAQYEENKPLIASVLASQQEQQDIQNEAQRIATVRSDDQWKQNQETYRPMEELSALNALGAQDMTDEQLNDLYETQGLDANTRDKVKAHIDAQRTAGENVAAQSKAAVITQSGRQQEAQRRSMAAMGLNPNSGRFQALDKQASTVTALTAAGAENMARANAKQQSGAKVADQANFGRGGTQVAAQQAGLGIQSGQAGVSAGNAAVGNSAAAGNAMSSGYSGAMKGNQGMGAGLTSLHQIESDNVNQANAATGAMVGAVAGMAGGMMSDKDKKTNKRKIKDGDALQAIEDMPVERWDYKEGESDGGEHIGAYAQDFKKATGIGDGKTIDIVSAFGITMKAVQDLSKKVDKIQSSKKA